MNDSSVSSIANSPSAVREAIQLGFYIGAGFGLAVGSAISIVLGSNLVWQAGGLFAGSALGICSGAAVAMLMRRMRPAAAPAYRAAR